MQFRLLAVLDSDRFRELEHAVVSADPSALLDHLPAEGLVRIATVIGGFELSTLLHSVGIGADVGRLELVPSECCGGCGG